MQHDTFYLHHLRSNSYNPLFSELSIKKNNLASSFDLHRVLKSISACAVTGNTFSENVKLISIDNTFNFNFTSLIYDEWYIGIIQ